MTSIIRSSAVQTARIAPRSFFISTANFASSSRHGLDFTRPRRFPTPSNPATTTTVVEDQLSTENVAEPAPSTESHQTPSTSNPNPEPVPTPKSAPITSSSSSTAPSAKLTVPQIPVAPRPKNTKGLPVIRWRPEECKISGLTKEQTPTHTLNVKSTRNNIVLSFTDDFGPVFGSVSGGSDKAFKNSQRSSYEAATQASIKMFEKILEFHRSQPHANRLGLRVSFNGLFGMGREALSSALSGPEGQEIRSLIVRVEDKTKVKIGGTRAPKPRRL
ncbi:uncharacterized protein I303_107182 [Kwoniella dejecticola CBS 10117]|uniref:Translational machinery component n=1 Tax=Kwoniella dejecticola CBS 10117 TaxID=1296121 RepID=A0A1A5ZYY8_9TREE|nr:uncharacterized protein I303_06583 [Kwoniella dejecticola CBS 10117]OBR83024.1 hypothetical protein I303_06583 [Kwoniella dejecticola CBS 10117]